MAPRFEYSGPGMGIGMGVGMDRDRERRPGGGQGAGPGTGPGGTPKFSGFGRETRCRFCRDRVKEIDYKEVGTLGKLVTNQGKLFSKKRSGNCAKHQRQLKVAAKRARFMALMPYVE